MLTRRAAVLSALSAGACVSTDSGGEPIDARFANLTTLSESVHSGVSSDDGQLRLTMRLCRYPELGLAWIWMHARTPDGFFSYVDHLAPCGHHKTATENENAFYNDWAAQLTFERLGRVDNPTQVTIRGACFAQRSPVSAFGRGDKLLTTNVRFTPERLYSGLNRGRTEVFGRAEATVTIDGKATQIEGPAQFHEQGQTNPRFTAPFCYMTLWGSGAASTMLIAPNRRDGYLLEGDRTTEVEDVTVDPPAARRALRVKLADGRTLEGEASVVQAYTIPLVGRTWRGHMMNVTLGDREYRGHINDYIIGAGVPYAGATG